MEKNIKNRNIIRSFLRDVKGLKPATWVHEFDAFYVEIWLNIDMSVSFYITWDKAVEAYNQHCNELLDIK